MAFLWILGYLLVGLGIFRFMNWLTKGVKFIEWVDEGPHHDYRRDEYNTPLTGFLNVLVWPVSLSGLLILGIGYSLHWMWKASHVSSLRYNLTINKIFGLK